jgi:hypothetical protein
VSHSPTRRSRLALAFVALLVAACGPSAEGPNASPAASQPDVVPATPGATPLPINVTEVKYGLLSVRTAPGVRCSAALQIAGGHYGDAPPSALPEESAGPNGLVSWTYPTPRIPSGTATYTASCQSSNASETKTGVFTIPTHPIVAASLRVRVTTDAPPHEQFNPDPSLVPLRDASLATIKTTLATQWRSATRGLGSLEVVDGSADITMFVIAARGTSVHRSSLADDSQDILLYVSGDLGPRNVENNVAVALHELGHIWCCHGPEATEAGHWATKQPSPGLYGVDKFGIMNEPVLCTQFGAILSCPNRFSDREMVALGFANFPAPAPDPCITQGLSLRSQINSLEAGIKTDEATLASLLSQIRAIEAQYPGGIPQPTYDRYLSLSSQYNTLYGQYSQRFDRYRGLLAQLNALPCDSS